MPSKSAAATARATSSAIPGGQMLRINSLAAASVASDPTSRKPPSPARTAVASLRPSLAHSTSASAAAPTSAPISPGKSRPTCINRGAGRAGGPASPHPEQLGRTLGLRRSRLEALQRLAPAEAGCRVAAEVTMDDSEVDEDLALVVAVACVGEEVQRRVERIDCFSGLSCLRERDAF